MARTIVLHPGFYCSIQDLGRLHYRNIGVPQSGAMDMATTTGLNNALGNEANAAVLEMIIKGATLKFEAPAIICLSQNITEVHINDQTVDFKYILQIQTGDILKIGRAIKSNFMYLSIAGGWQTPVVLRSRSMYNGITQNGHVQRDEVLSFESNRKEVDRLNYKEPVIISDSIGTKKSSDKNHVLKIEVRKGPEFDTLPQSLQNSLFNIDLQLSMSWNRMAYTIHTGLKNLLPQLKTVPVQPGTVQLTPHGDLIVLMRDAQTTGGYPRILQLSDREINTISRLKTADVFQMNLIAG